MEDFIKYFSYEWLWIISFILFVVVEVMSVSLLTIWFAAGSLVALLFAFMDFTFTIQLVIFFSVSIILLIFTRPILKKYVYKNKKDMKTNVDSMIGKTGYITRKITEHEFGELKIDGQTWSAVSENREEIDEGSTVQVLAIKGVKLIVKKV